MKTLTQIENALKAINDAVFQTLINHLLFLQGDKFIGAPGAVVGKEKTSKGSPDSFFLDENQNKYIFVECTTLERLGESKTFFQKLSNDIDHCFAESKTAIPKEKITKVVLACNEKITAEEHSLLHAKVKSYNDEASLKLLNIQNLPMEISEIPKLAEEYLDVQIIKGDIFRLEDFLLKTMKGLQPSLTNEFIGRATELEDSIEALKTYDILLLWGGAGVGKSKLAVKILQELSKDDYIPIVIQSSGVSLWDDYQHLFLPGKQYIILFDDANKSIKNLEYLLSKLAAPKAFSAKVVITSRDYVKKQISEALDIYPSKELKISNFKDEEIDKIIVSALPNLKHYSDLTRQIIDLAKGNARVALMATYSVTPDAETNYLTSPVLLYEKYFKKIAEEIGIFDDPIFLKSLAIVSFFGVLDRNNEEQKAVLEDRFGIGWNDLWSAILELHNSEIVDVYSNEIVKVSDQVLATYAFYKCFIDDQTAVINYAEWIIAFVEKHSNKIRTTLVDVNNTFTYYHIKKLVLPHLDRVAELLESEDQKHAFYKLFWFYKGRDCLLYLRKWIQNLPEEDNATTFVFNVEHNDSVITDKYFELLVGFWDHQNELLKPSLELVLTLANKQPSRLPEILKSLNEHLKYKIDDVNHGFLRQNTLMDILLDEKWDASVKLIADGVFINLSKILLGWHYTEHGSVKGNEFRFYNFTLHKSDRLTALRSRILTQVYDTFSSENKSHLNTLMQIVCPGGDIDSNIYLDELPIHQKFISEKLDVKKFAHCEFVSELANHVTAAGSTFPQNWNNFIYSDIQKLSKFLKIDWDYNEEKSIDECEREKKKEFDEFVESNDWPNFYKFLLNVDELYKQTKEENNGQIEFAMHDIFIALARKNKEDFKRALLTLLKGEISFTLQTGFINIVLHEKLMDGKELAEMIESYEFKEKMYWQAEVLRALPREQINDSFLKLLLDSFHRKDANIYVSRMTDYLKYESAFELYKEDEPELKNHNIITYLTTIILSKEQKSRLPFGLHFFSTCASFFTKHTQLLQTAYWTQQIQNQQFDYDGRELKAILNLDRFFIHKSLKEDLIGVAYSYDIRIKDVKANVLWDYEDHEELIESLLFLILEKAQFSSTYEEAVFRLFTFKSYCQDRVSKIKTLILKLTNKHSTDEKLIPILIEVVYNSYRDWFMEYFREYLLLVKDINITKKIMFGRSSGTSGSWVPVHEKKIKFYQDIVSLINTLPNLLDYADHIDHFEKKIAWKSCNLPRK